MKSLVWLASYPKSGNTWLRTFLANYIFDAETPVSINQINKIGSSDSDPRAYRHVTKGVFDPADPVQGAKIRMAVLQMIVNNGADVNFLKSHSENGTVFGTKLIPVPLTRSAVYILRNPLDMIISFANHQGRTIDQSIDIISNKRATLRGDGISTYQYLGTWSNHVSGWTKEKKFPVLSLKYEDLLADPHEGFGRVIRHIGLPENQKQLDKAVRFSDFKVLQNQETLMGFKENPDHQKRFFRSGKSDQWKEILTSEQVARIAQDHCPMMKKFGYEV